MTPHELLASTAKPPLRRRLARASRPRPLASPSAATSAGAGPGATSRPPTSSPRATTTASTAPQALPALKPGASTSRMRSPACAAFPLPSTMLSVMRFGAARQRSPAGRPAPATAATPAERLACDEQRHEREHEPDEEPVESAAGEAAVDAGRRRAGPTSGAPRWYRTGRRRRGRPAARRPGPPAAASSPPATGWASGGLPLRRLLRHDPTTFPRWTARLRCDRHEPRNGTGGDCDRDHRRAVRRGWSQTWSQRLVSTAFLVSHSETLPRLSTPRVL